MYSLRASKKRKVRLAVLGLAVAIAVASPAYAISDLDFARLVQVETEKFVAETTTKAAELAAKGEPPKTGELTESSASCAGQTQSPAFSAFGDSADYTLVPGGTFEDGAPGWQLENETRIVSTNSPYNASGPGANALSIPKGTKVTTRPLCITANHPTLRFFLSAKGSSRARLFVEALYEDLGGSVKVLPIAYLEPTSTWQPTSIVALQVNLRAALDPSGTAAVAFRFTAEEDDATWLIDDVYVDPFKSR